MLAVSWRDVVLAVLPSAQLTDGAPSEAVAAASERLGAALPEDLAALLAETDGVRSPDGQDLVWPLARLVVADGLLVFGDSGGGSDRVAYDALSPAHIVVWNRDTDERRPVAVDLADYLTRVLVEDDY
ncbi:SMI1/KNR4 family protein [Actinoplanes sp. TFC3]|uniref:SMI1/KNR4 family protein n=1 Tax=Actinoplanes sp. TFC3 TaxID=1710355 RepID=UPI0009E70AAD|nr:SMI1/KNR4 family protein [Actinoplanes sp. TFC3]